MVSKRSRTKASDFPSAEATTSAQAQAAPSESMWRGHHMTLSPSSQLMKASTTMTCLLQETVAILAQDPPSQQQQLRQLTTEDRNQPKMASCS